MPHSRFLAADRFHRRQRIQQGLPFDRMPAQGCRHGRFKAVRTIIGAICGLATPSQYTPHTSFDTRNRVLSAAKLTIRLEMSSHGVSCCLSFTPPPSLPHQYLLHLTENAAAASPFDLLEEFLKLDILTRAAGSERSPASLQSVYLTCRSWRDILSDPKRLASVLVSRHGASHAAMMTYSWRQGPADNLPNLRPIDLDATRLHICQSSAKGACNRLEWEEVLVSASIHGHSPIVEELLKLPEERPRAACMEGSSLHFAAGQGHEKIVQQLLSAELDDAPEGAEEDGVSKWNRRLYNTENGSKALAAAAYNGHLSVMELLLQTEKQDLVEDSKEAVRLTDKMALVVRGPWKSCALRIEVKSKGAFLAAIRGQHSAAIVSLTRYAAWYHWRDNEEDCPYSVAATVGNYDVMRILLNYGGDPSLHCLSRALIPACQHGSTRIVHLIASEMCDTIPFGYPDDFEEVKKHLKELLRYIQNGKLVAYSQGHVDIGDTMLQLHAAVQRVFRGLDNVNDGDYWYEDISIV